ncbi:O-methyltransferase [Haloarculaceae archaeon H-GB2-1]|nr:O-methyltransferase [Haloarculaceae archaeon H-GB1-1]MEA5386114.1 O-methyltransferase [Haloarculaceae archaeon H-GB11]MEA5407621.1 O-methyltransferase [Haloarculaceae archaeon H-GB2-1]
MSDTPIPDEIARFARAIGSDGDDVIAEMDAYADREGFPTVGPEVGGWLRLLARAVDAERAFEFGSGFGYSAYWLAEALPADGEVVLTEVDADELDQARTFLDRGGYADRARFEHGDAIDIVERYDGPFDVVLVDNEKHRYVEAFEAVREKIAPGGVVLADNAITAGHVDFDALLADAEGGDAEMNDATQGIADYLDVVRSDPAFETSLLPLGEGVAVSVRVE